MPKRKTGNINTTTGWNTKKRQGKQYVVDNDFPVTMRGDTTGLHLSSEKVPVTASVTPSGGEIGRAQAVQAEAAGVDSRVEMNPVLLKPEADHTSQVVLMGKPLRSAKAIDYFSLKTQLWESVRSSLDILREEYDIVVIVVCR